MTNAVEAWFDLDDNLAVPRPHAHAPWADDMLHGRYLAGLAAREVEAGHLNDQWVPARLTIDLFRAPPMSPVSVTSERIRDGARVRVIDVRLRSEQQPVAQARILVVRSDRQRVGPTWSRDPWDIAHPDDLAPPAGVADVAAPWQFRTEPDRFIESAGPGRCWTRDLAQLVAGEPMTPFVRAATSADLASPLSNSGPGGLAFINADITLSLVRLPRSDWLGYETITHEQADGVSISSCAVHDLDGAIGLSTVSAVIY